MLVRSGFPFNYDADEASKDAGLKCLDVSLTKQSFKEECDINTIVERFGIGYEMPEGVVAPTYGDFTGLDGDFHGMCNAIAQANESFMALPANVRARFENDPAKFVDFCSREESRDELQKLGLLVDKPVVSIDAPEPVSVAPAVPSAPVVPSTAPVGG